MSLVNITFAGNKIPVRLPNNKGWVYATVSPEDHAALSAPEMRWRMGSSGYPMFVKRVNKELTTVWMHKIVGQGPATHINGDRLDCRRENLIPSARKSPFELKTPESVWDTVEEFDWNDRDLRLYTGFANVSYDEGKTFSGQVVHGIPHGFGTLYEPVPRKQSSGNWVEGQLKLGMVTEFEYMPRADGRVKHIQLIK
jgi:hypothetical protein